MKYKENKAAETEEKITEKLKYNLLFIFEAVPHETLPIMKWNIFLQCYHHTIRSNKFQ